MPRLKHLLLTSVEDLSSVTSWSGIPWSLRKALEQQVERVTVFRPSRPSRHPVDVIKRAFHGGTPPRYPLWMTQRTLRNNAREVQREIDRTQPDAVLSISSQCVAELNAPGRPVYLFSDAPWLAWMEAYRGTVMEPVGMAAYAAREAAAAQRLHGLFFGSTWAIQEAERLYGDQIKDRLHVTPLGANWTPSLPREAVLQHAAARPIDRLHLLFVGKDWERKGGPLALEVARLLHTPQRPVTLHIVGCRPALPPDAHRYTEVHGLLFQNDPMQSAKLETLFLDSHFLLVPTTAECFGIVFAEAQAFALPPISRAIHALPTVVLDGETGLLLPPAATAGAYVQRVRSLLQDGDAYQRMALAALGHFEEHLTWSRTAERICSVIEHDLGDSAIDSATATR